MTREDEASRLPSLAYWLVMPAAGAGTRMQAGDKAVPKQYIALAGRSVMEHALDPFIADDDCEGIVVALQAQDRYFHALPVATHPKVFHTLGGGTRRESVLKGLQDVRQRVASRDAWVWVHDAARPCVRRADIDRLKAALSRHPAGALLAVRVNDTLKRANPTGVVEATVPRDGIWRALTPQAFRLDALTEALTHCPEATDEASAMEASGAFPLLVAGEADNMKITESADVAVALQILRGRSR